MPSYNIAAAADPSRTPGPETTTAFYPQSPTTSVFTGGSNAQPLLFDILTILFAAASLLVAYLHLRHGKRSQRPVSENTDIESGELAEHGRRRNTDETDIQPSDPSSGEGPAFTIPDRASEGHIESVGRVDSTTSTLHPAGIEDEAK
ncbi:uncharacterized protein BDZ99DRAFT_499194 [Mytilinidion resinicola]|uniref:Uncharacterized protein n=1 Tax=Mytilinidion resinicola TaxID=574789 RepID=A0A6A6YLE0_9PEZI|nr:uncharacterized protein BDZ99DRAFT_499194 [Mytilinidion resinicola]KAF2808795.1 hypothetical protein BDZ99DRAFT_499194 [Mytilinidion resinicola]